MQRFDVKQLAGPKDWSGPTFTGFGETAVKLRWIKESWEWHVNNGDEIFMVLDGTVEMHVRRPGDPTVLVERLEAGQLMLIEDGEAHIAHPQGEARILVVERAEA